MEEELNRHNLSELYPTFLRESVTLDVLWLLTENDVREMGLTVGQRRRYFLAAEKETIKSTHLGKGN